MTGASPVSAPKPQEEDGNKLSLISWNVDGLDTDNLVERARGLCSIIVLYVVTYSLGTLLISIFLLLLCHLENKTLTSFISRRYTPDVVFLQELIPPYVQYLKKRAVSYLIIEGDTNRLIPFSVLLIRSLHTVGGFYFSLFIFPSQLARRATSPVCC